MKQKHGRQKMSNDLATEFLPTLIKMSDDCFLIARKIQKNNCPAEVVDAFNDHWDAIRQLIRTVKQKETNNE
jgi:hypothetical protein